MARTRSRSTRLTADLLGLLVFVVCAFPVYWMVNTSLLPRREINAPDPTWLPFGGTLLAVAACPSTTAAADRHD